MSPLAQIRCNALSAGAYAPLSLSMRLNLAISRDLRRAALFLWMMPLPATRSSMLRAARTACAAASRSPDRMAISARLTNVRAAVRYGRFRWRRRSATRIRFSADLLFANDPHLTSNHQATAGMPKFGPQPAASRW